MVAELLPTTGTSTEDPDTFLFGVYNTAARRRAAREGWETRRRGMTTGRRFRDLAHQVADGPARLLCCDLTERIALPVFQAAFPDDPRPALILWMARRYARGAASEYERLATRKLSLALADEVAQGYIFPRTPAGLAMQAIGWCGNKSTSSMLWACTNWLEGLMEPPYEAFYQEVVTALEAMPTRTTGRCSARTTSRPADERREVGTATSAS